MGLQQNVPTQTGGPSAPCRAHQQNAPAYTCGKSVPPQSSQQNVQSASPRRSKKIVPPVPSQPSQQNVSTQVGCSSTPSVGNQFFKFASSSTLTQKSQSKTAKMPKTQNPASHHHRSDTFWTVCRGCSIYFEYLKKYCNHTLLCRSCKKPFMALEIAPPVFSRSEKPIPWDRWKHSSKKLPGGQNAYDPKVNAAAAPKPGLGHTGPNSFTYTSYQQASLPKTANTAAENPGNVVQQAHDNLKRAHIESHASSNMKKCFKKGKVDDDSNGYGTKHSMAQGKFGT